MNSLPRFYFIDSLHSQPWKIKQTPIENGKTYTTTTGWVKIEEEKSRKILNFVILLRRERDLDENRTVANLRVNWDPDGVLAIFIPIYYLHYSLNKLAYHWIWMQILINCAFHVDRGILCIYAFYETVIMTWILYFVCVTGYLLLFLFLM